MAPMADVSNLPFRLIVLQCGSGMTTSEEIDASALVYSSQRSIQTARFLEQEKPIALQLLGADPAHMAQAAAMLQDMGADVVDINMGCPVRKIVAKGKGAALMQDLPRTRAILEAVREAISIPLTIKIRGGWDHEHLNAVEVSQLAESVGVDGITVHPRTRSQQFSGKAPWEIIRDVVEAVDIPVTGNGDVTSRAEARLMMEQTGCASVMVGRGAMGAPWIFSEEFEYMDRDAQDEYKRGVIEDHVRLVEEYLSERRALIQIKKNVAWYITTGWRAKIRRREIFECTSVPEIWDVFQKFWEMRRHDEELIAAAMAARAPESPFVQSQLLQTTTAVHPASL
ncbi:MAG: tRNA dihydrouridine synthase DusB [Chloroflexi bacterium]|nr:tRNA dihydrouridine synthase DusB [Chloroflexota bacterium]